MKQILQNLKSGETVLEEIPAPRLGAGSLLIRTTTSLVSAGTERMLVDFGRANLIDKARQQPDKVRMVVDKVKTDGLVPTVEAVRSKLDQPLPLGYCNVGRVMEVGAGVEGFEAGDRVASNGRHAEVVSVPRNLCAKIPDGVADEAAAFTVIGAIALQGIRLAQPTLGEAVVVTGPGRYDPAYEEQGQDYPVGFVRWTEQRNFEAVLDMLADGRLDVAPLVSHRFRLDDAEAAYAVVGGSEPSLGILLEYPSPEERPDEALRGRTVALPAAGATRQEEKVALGFVGSGNYATQVLIPAFKATGARLRSVASSGGVSGVHAGRKYGFEQSTTDAAALLADAAVNTVVVTTRHDSHARFVIDALGAGKHVFVEKPLALTREELADIERAYGAAGEAGAAPVLMVGFNRRFSPLIRKAKTLIDAVSEPKSFVMTVNAGAIPPDHWTQDRAVGGGRIIGEGCHFVDLLRFLAGSAVEGVQAVAMGGAPGVAVRSPG